MQPDIRWIRELVFAVDNDNLHPTTLCAESATSAVLRRAPAPTPQIRLALEDLHSTPRNPLTRLRSNAVANQFTTGEDPTVNVLVARMTVPGGPWPGHYGLEAIAFRSRAAVMPTWFPPHRGKFGLHFGEITAASRGYRDGSGSVLFPEQVSVSKRGRRQSFGVVFMDRLHSLLTRIVPLLEPGTVPQRNEDLRRLRQEAFLAHERGHLQGSDLESATVLAPTRRLAAVVSELHADLDALVMLLSSDAPTVANVLVADRVIREAWLKRPYAQVDAVAARQLLGLLIRWRAITLTDTDQVRLNLTRARSRLTEELERVRELERRCLREGSEAALNYLRESGWQIIGKNCHRESTSRLGRYLAWSSVRR